MATVRYLVDDVDAALEFYTDRLGFTLTERWGPPFAVVSRDGLTLWLSGPGTSAAEAMPDGREPEPGGWNRLVIVVGDVKATATDLSNAGVVFRNQVSEGPGGKQVLVEDPAGNPVEVFEPADGG